jgi:YggT family protein
LVFFNWFVTAVYWLINLLSFLIFVRALISWLPFSENSKVNSFLIMMTEPVIAPIRKLLGKLKVTRELPVDFSPVVAIIVLSIISGLLVLL